MGILTIKPATRAGSKVVIGIAGTSGSGKTYTALKIARGMVSSPAEVGLLDTENGRGRLYSSILDGQFMHADLYAPFSPARYRQAIKEFQDAGVKVLVIDSASHEWEGDGGCEEIAAAGVKVANWKLAKSEHKKFMSALLQSNMHIIVCLRAREKTSFVNPKAPQSLGMQPVCEKNFMFEMTASMMMWNEGRQQEFLKLPEALHEVFGNGDGYLNESHGKSLMDWVNKGDPVDEEFEHWRSTLQMAAGDGVASLNEMVKSIPESVKPKIRGIWSQLKSSAEEFDRIKESGEDPVTPLAQNIASAGEGFNPANTQKADKIQQPKNEPAQAAENIEDF
ncbi:MAG: hypothetical protein [Caudoviricetes sp.]|nr:MAG: hypothetical protein [Caudoviricetes sp.]